MTKLKEATDVLILGQVLATSYKAAKADGVINWMDAPKFAAVIGASRTAIEGGDKIQGEFKEATQEELVAFAEFGLQVALSLIAVVVTK